MKKILCMVMLFVSTQTASAWTEEDFRIAGKKVEVNIIDDVDDGCWTNLGEVRRYAEDKLSNAGADVEKEVSYLIIGATYQFNVSVVGYRLGSGGCIGSVRTELRTITGEPSFHFAYVHHSMTLYSGGRNLNDRVLDTVGKSIRELN